MGRRIADEVDVYGFMARGNVKEGDVIFIDPLSGLEGLCRHFFFPLLRLFEWQACHPALVGSRPFLALQRQPEASN